ncbi:MAG: glycosyl hydrolase [Chloroflexi bacterium]|nr:glycosyl hydrolase [Chloroflexota bacterium]
MSEQPKAPGRFTRRGLLVRSARLAAAVAGMGLAGTQMAAERAEAAPELPNAERAAVTYVAMQKYFYLETEPLYRQTYPHSGGPRYSFHWPFTQVLAATLGRYGLAGTGSDFEREVAARLAGLAAYWDPGSTPPAYDSYPRAPYGTGAEQYYDDNVWAGLALVQLYRMLRGSTDPVHQQQAAFALERAVEVFRLMVSGWDTDPTHPAPGGVFWVKAAWSRDRNVVSNAPGAELGFHLYELTGRAHYLEWGRRMYEWVERYLRAPNGLYWDHVDLTGVVEETQWSYNQGTMIGANALLYRITREAKYLAAAERIAETALVHYRADSRFYPQPAAFNAIFFRNLLLLAGINRNPRYRAAMQLYADILWHDQTAHDWRTRLFYLGGPGRPAELLDQAAMIQIYAYLAWPPNSYALLT